MLLNQERLSELFDMHYNDIYYFCLSMVKNEHDAEDITQETFEFLIEKADTLVEANLRAWIYNVAAIKIKQYFRRKKLDFKHIVFTSDQIPEIIDTQSPCIFDEDLIFEDLSPELIDEYKDKILSFLSDEEKALYIDVFVNKKKYKEIGEELDINPKTISVRAYRLKTKIKELIKNTIQFFIFFIIFANFFNIF